MAETMKTEERFTLVRFGEGKGCDVFDSRGEIHTTLYRTEYQASIACRLLNLGDRMERAFNTSGPAKPNAGGVAKHTHGAAPGRIETVSYTPTEEHCRNVPAFFDSQLNDRATLNGALPADHFAAVVAQTETRGRRVIADEIINKQLDIYAKFLGVSLDSPPTK
jgi:hypothetical protein